MHGLGNDFMVIDNTQQMLDIKNIPIPLLADRYRGIGFDQLLLIEKSSVADFACRIFNVDGSEAEHCGNGIRCVARFILEEQLIQKKSLTLETLAGLIEVKIHHYDNIEVKMGIPCFEPATIPFLPSHQDFLFDVLTDYPSCSLPLTVLSLGNPHAVLSVSTLYATPIAEIGLKIATHPAFPNGANVGFMEIVNPHHIRLRTFERGVGVTLACGSNACAAVIAGILYHGLEHKVNVELTYGNLSIEWAGENFPVSMSGPAARVFSGTYVI